MQVHHIGSKADVDAAYEGLDNPGDKSLPRIGAIACLLDYRDGTNLTGLNPQHRKWIRHIGITGHENPAVHMDAIQRDTRNILDTLLVAVNPNDPRYSCHQTNSIPVAHAKGMGIVGMKVFADGVMYGLKQGYAHRPGQSVPTVGQPDKLPYEDFIRYSLNPAGMSTIITGIGLIDKEDNPATRPAGRQPGRCPGRQTPDRPGEKGHRANGSRVARDTHQFLPAALGPVSCRRRDSR